MKRISAPEDDFASAERTGREGKGRGRGDSHLLLAALLPLGDALVLPDGHGCSRGGGGG